MTRTIHEEKMVPFTERLNAKLEKHAEEVAEVLIAALKAQTRKYFAHQGEVKDKRDYVDHPTRIRAADEIVEIMGAKAAKEIDITGEFGLCFRDALEIVPCKTSGKSPSKK